MAEDKKGAITSLVPTEESPKYTSAEEILSDIIEVVDDQLNVELEDITPDATFQDKLAADSLDIVEMIMAFEEKVLFKIPDEDAEKLKTVADVVNYIADKYGLPYLAAAGEE